MELEGGAAHILVVAFPRAELGTPELLVAFKGVGEGAPNELVVAFERVDGFEEGATDEDRACPILQLSFPKWTLVKSNNLVITATRVWNMASRTLLAFLKSYRMVVDRPYLGYQEA